jgi:hypothetical protein
VGLVLAAVVALSAVGSSAASAACPNEQFRTGPSAKLPDCRAYELVTPADLTGFFVPGRSGFEGFATSMTLTGDDFSWTLLNGSRAGDEANGQFTFYKATRGPSGWVNTRFGPSAVQAQGSAPSSFNGNHEFFVVAVQSNRGGTLAAGCCLTYWIRYPDGSYHLLGEGTVPTVADTDGFENGLIDDPGAQIDWISTEGDHQIFASLAKLTPEAPDEPTNEIFDRTPSGLRLVSLLPGDVPSPGGTYFAGASLDGSTVLFESGGNTFNEGSLYARLDNARTIELASAAAGEIQPGGVSADGSEAFFVQGGEIYRYDFASEKAFPILNPGPGDAIMSYVSPDFSHVLFISESELVPGKGETGSPNLYVWDRTGVQFVAKLDPEDLVHGDTVSGTARGLAFWTPSYRPGAAATNTFPSAVAARSTPDGRIFAFESKAELTNHPTNGHFAIYRFDTSSEALVCVSCGPANPETSSDSGFILREVAPEVPSLSPMFDLPNLSSDGEAIVFETADSLLPRDVNGALDVYQWRAGALSLLSTGTSSQHSRLAGVSPSGNDVFLLSGQQLVGQSPAGGSFAVYDARVNGGLASQQTEQTLECSGEACQGQPGRPPLLPQPGSSTLSGRGNVKTCQHRPHKRRHQHRRKARVSQGSSHHKHKQGCRTKRGGARR